MRGINPRRSGRYKVALEKALKTFMREYWVAEILRCRSIPRAAKENGLAASTLYRITRWVGVRSPNAKGKQGKCSGNWGD